MTRPGTRRAAGGFPLLNARWRVRAANHPSDEEIIEQQQRLYRDQGIPALPGLHPLAVGDVVVMGSPQRLIAVDFQTGKRIWEFPWFEAPDEDVLQSDRIRPDRPMMDPASMELSRCVWDDAPYGQMSSDGRQVFLLWGLGADPREGPVQLQIPGQQVPNQQVPNPLGGGNANKLVSLDLRAQGKLRWIVGDTDGADEPELAGAFFWRAAPFDGSTLRAEWKSAARSGWSCWTRRRGAWNGPSSWPTWTCGTSPPTRCARGRRIALVLGRSPDLPDIGRSGGGGRHCHPLRCCGAINTRKGPTRFGGESVFTPTRPGRWGSVGRTRQLRSPTGASC